MCFDYKNSVTIEKKEVTYINITPHNIKYLIKCRFNIKILFSFLLFCYTIIII